MSHLLAGYYIHFEASTTACKGLVLLRFVNLLFCFWLVKHRLILVAWVIFDVQQPGFLTREMHL